MNKKTTTLAKVAMPSQLLTWHYQ